MTKDQKTQPTKLFLFQKCVPVSRPSRVVAVGAYEEGPLNGKRKVSWRILKYLVYSRNFLSTKIMRITENATKQAKDTAVRGGADIRTYMTSLLTPRTLAPLAGEKGSNICCYLRYFLICYLNASSGIQYNK